MKSGDDGLTFSLEGRWPVSIFGPDVGGFLHALVGLAAGMM
jgi:hypothetical protein